MQIAQTIIDQLGGNQFIRMCGIKNIYAMENGVQFSIPRNASKATKVCILLTGADLYNVEFFKQAGAAKMFECTTVAKWEGYYDFMLVPEFEKITGMKTKLF